MILPNQCYIELTQNCNLRCKHCFAAAKQCSKEIDLHDIKMIFSQLEDLGIYSVNLSGGEPVLNKNFFEIMEYVAKQPFEITVLTNGMLWDQSMFDLFIKSVPQKNIKIQVSLDGDYNSMFQQRGICDSEYEKIIANIKMFKSNGFRVGCLFVANSLTIKDAISICKNYVKELNIDGIKIVPMFPMGRAQDNIDALGEFWESWSKLVVEFTCLKKKEKDDPILKKIKMSFFNLYELVVPLDNAGMHSDIYDVWNLDVDNLDNYRKQIHRKFFCEVGYSELVISSEMHMYPCVASVRSDLKVGNLKEEMIADLWENSEVLGWFRDNLDKVILQEPCVRCKYKDFCGGGCRLISVTNECNNFIPDSRCPIVRQYYKEKSEK